MSCRAVLIEPNGRRVDIVLERELPAYRCAVYQPMRVRVDGDQAAPMRGLVETFTKSRRRMFDGRVIYCAPPWHVEECRYAWLPPIGAKVEPPWTWTEGHAAIDATIAETWPGRVVCLDRGAYHGVTGAGISIGVRQLVAVESQPKAIAHVDPYGITTY